MEVSVLPLGFGFLLTADDKGIVVDGNIDVSLLQSGKLDRQFDLFICFGHVHVGQELHSAIACTTREIFKKALHFLLKGGEEAAALSGHASGGTGDGNDCSD